MDYDHGREGLRRFGAIPGGVGLLTTPTEHTGNTRRFQPVAMVGRRGLRDKPVDTASRAGGVSILLQGGKSGPGAQQIRAGLDRLRQFRLGLGRVTETQVAEADQVMRVGRLEARSLSSATSAAAAAAAGFGGRRLLERKLAGVHQALEDRLGLVGLAELLKA